MSRLLKTLKDTGAIRWVALLCLALPMFASYFFDDIAARTRCCAYSAD